MSEAGRIAFGVAAERGVRVRILTNAVEATGVAPVQVVQGAAHAGVALYEMRRAATGVSSRLRAVGGSSGTSLHAKTFAVDSIRVAARPAADRMDAVTRRWRRRCRLFPGARCR